MERTIKHQFEYAHTPEVVWEYLTNSELLAQWFLPNDFKAEKGHKFHFISKPMPLFGFDGMIHCEVLNVSPNKMISYTWKGGNLDSVVTWTLEPKGKGTILTLEHAGFKGVKNLMPYFIMGKGWLKLLQKIAKQMTTA